MQKWVAMLGVNDTALEASLIHTKDWVEMWVKGNASGDVLIHMQKWVAESGHKVAFAAVMMHMQELAVVQVLHKQELAVVRKYPDTWTSLLVFSGPR